MITERAGAEGDVVFLIQADGERVGIKVWGEGNIIYLYPVFQERS